MFYCGLMKVEKLKKCNVSNAGIAHIWQNERREKNWRKKVVARDMREDTKMIPLEATH